MSRRGVKRGREGSPGPSSSPWTFGFSKPQTDAERERTVASLNADAFVATQTRRFDALMRSAPKRHTPPRSLRPFRAQLVDGFSKLTQTSSGKRLPLQNARQTYDELLARVDALLAAPYV